MKYKFPSGIAACLLGLAAAAVAPALAQSYPAKPVRLVVPYAAGATDSVARLIGEKLQAAFGQPFLVDNRPGASGAIGTDLVAKAPPDGYTLLVMGDAVLTQLPFAMSKLPYRPEQDFAPVTQLTNATTVLIVNAGAPWKSAQELLSYSKANPDKVNFGSASVYGQVMQEQLKVAGLATKNIPYRGGAQLSQAIMAGEVDSSVMDIGTVVAAIPRVRPLAVFSPKRHPKLPDVPTIGELGFERLTGDIWYAMFAPAGTPQEVIAKLNAELAKILAMPDVKEKMSTIGMDPTPSTPAVLEKMVRDDSRHWSPIIKAAGIRLD